MNVNGGSSVVVEIRPCGPDERGTMLSIINAAAEAYRGVIPEDRWHEPYMPAEDLESEIADGVVFSGAECQGRLIGLMGVQRRGTVDLIRHAYVLPEMQRHRVGSKLIGHLCSRSDRPILVGTWRSAIWAIRFYERHGFARVADADVEPLLRTYWRVPDRQIATSVVLALPSTFADAAT